MCLGTIRKSPRGVSEKDHMNQKKWPMGQWIINCILRKVSHRGYRESFFAHSCWGTCCTSSFISSLSLLRWLFALLLLGQLRSPWLSEGSIGRPVSSLEQWQGEAGTHHLLGAGSVLSSARAWRSHYLATPHRPKNVGKCYLARGKQSKKINKSNDLELKADISRKQL